MMEGFLYFVESKITSCPGGSMVEHQTSNLRVVGSSPISDVFFYFLHPYKFIKITLKLIYINQQSIFYFYKFYFLLKCIIMKSLFFYFNIRLKFSFNIRLYLLVRKLVEVFVNKMKLRSKCLIKMSVDIICESSYVQARYSKEVLLC